MKPEKIRYLRRVLRCTYCKPNQNENSKRRNKHYLRSWKLKRRTQWQKPISKMVGFYVIGRHIKQAIEVVHLVTKHFVTFVTKFRIYLKLTLNKP